MRSLLLSVAFLVLSVASFAQTITLAPLTKLDYCVNDVATAQYSTIGTFASDNQFVLQISTDSFKSWTIIGRDTKATGQIYAKLGSAGTGYRVRVASINPIVASNDNGSDITVKTPPGTPDVGIVSRTEADYDNMFLDQFPDVIGDTIRLFALGSYNPNISWHLDSSAFVTSQSTDTVSLIFPTAGMKTNSITSNSPCGGTTRQLQIEVFDCHQVIHSKIHTVTGTESGTYDSVLVKSGGQYSDNGKGVVFVEAGGSVVGSYGGHGFYFVMRGGSVTVPDHLYWNYVFADSGVSVTLPEIHQGLQIMHCNDLEFSFRSDTAFAVNRTVWDAGSIPTGSSDSMFFQVSNKSDPGVTLIGSVDSPSDPAFVISSGGGAYSIPEKSLKPFRVVYHSDGNTHNSSLLVHGPRPQDTIRVTLTALQYNSANVLPTGDQSLNFRQISSHLFVRSDAPVSVRLINLLGTEVLQREGESSYDIDLSQLLPGVYWAVAEVRCKQEIRKVIVSH